MCTDSVFCSGAICVGLPCRRVSFICGRAGVFALGAVAAKLANDGRLVEHYLEKFKDVIMPFHISPFISCCLPSISILKF